jgi:hypothetical protein
MNTKTPGGRSTTASSCIFLLKSHRLRSPGNLAARQTNAAGRVTRPLLLAYRYAAAR